MHARAHQWVLTHSTHTTLTSIHTHAHTSQAYIRTHTSPSSSLTHLSWKGNSTPFRHRWWKELLARVDYDDDDDDDIVKWKRKVFQVGVRWYGKANHCTIKFAFASKREKWSTHTHFCKTGIFKKNPARANTTNSRKSGEKKEWILKDGLKGKKWSFFFFFKTLTENAWSMTVLLSTFFCRQISISRPQVAQGP